MPDSADTVAVSIGVHRALIERSSLSAALRAVRVEIPLVGAAFDVIGDDVTFSGRASLSS